MTDFAIGIPTLNRADLLQPSLFFYFNRDFPNTKIYVLDNGKQSISKNFPIKPLRLSPEPSNLVIIDNEPTMGVAESWNYLLDLIYKDHKHALIMNDDVYLASQTHHMESHFRIYDGFSRSTEDWCVFMLSKEVYNKVGKFDTEFKPAYYEDMDYEYRMKLKNVRIDKTPSLNPYIYRNNSTSEKDPSVKNGVERNKSYYILKWGGEPKKEKFTKPFNL